MGVGRGIQCRFAVRVHGVVGRLSTTLEREDWRQGTRVRGPPEGNHSTSVPRGSREIVVGLLSF